MRSKSVAWGTVAVVCLGAVLAALAVDARAAGSIRPAPGTPDPRAMVLTSADLGRAKVTAQRYFKDPDFPSVISYEREFEDGKFGATPLPYVDSQAEIGTSAATTTRFLGLLRTFFASKEARKLIVESFEDELPIDGLVSNIQIARPRNLGVGPGSFDVLVTARVLGLRTEFHIAVFRVEQVLGLVSAVGEPGRRLPLSVMRRLAQIMATRMTVQLAPRNTTPPTVSGVPSVGQTLTSTTGTWVGSPSSFSYQWQRCDPVGANCASISGATGQSYSLVAADVGATLRVSVTARSATGAATATSAPTGVVSASGAPTSTSLPTISGVAQVGQTLTAGTGSWTGNPTGFAFQWQRCNSSGTGCVDMPGATSGTYVVASADLGATIRVVVTATNGLGSGSAASPATAVVT
jgi:hypothetical protein